MSFLLPLLVLLFLLRYHRRLAPLPYIVATAVLLALQFGMSLEVFAMFLVFGCLGLLVFGTLVAETRPRLWAVTTQTGLAFAGALILLIPYLYFMVRGYANVPSMVHPISAFSINAANYFIPTPLTLIGGSQLTVLSRHFTANVSENGGYIGLPFIAIGLYVAVRYWHHKFLRATVVLLALILLCALGPTLHLIGQVGGLPLPWRLVSWLPPLKSAQPDRFTLYGFLVLAVLVAYWCALRTTPRRRNLKYAAALVGMACILPAPAQYQWSKAAVPSVFKAGQISRYIARGSNILILPFGNLGSGIYYQYASHMWFKQAGGYVGFTPNNYAQDRLVTTLASGEAYPGFEQDLSKFCRGNQVQKIVYTPGTAPALVQTIGALGWPSQHLPDATVVNVPGR